MDVQCERCKTEYEFDDALVSGRGTTVKCTNCGFQFKVHKKDAGEPGTDDRWLVRTKDGQQHVFITLKELQRAILAKGVGRHDTLTRGNAPPRALGSIAELAPFFDEKKRMSTIPPVGSVPPPPYAAPPPQRKPSYPGFGETRTGNTPPMGSPKVTRSTPPPPSVTRAYVSRTPSPAAPSEERSTSLGIGAVLAQPAQQQPAQQQQRGLNHEQPHKREKVDTLRPALEATQLAPAGLPRLASLPHVVAPGGGLTRRRLWRRRCPRCTA